MSTEGTRGLFNYSIVSNSGNWILHHGNSMDIPWKSIACNRLLWKQLLFYTNYVPVLRRTIAFRVSIDFSKINGKSVEIPWIFMDFFFTFGSFLVLYRYREPEGYQSDKGLRYVRSGTSTVGEAL
jgi:hypothetical protein